MGRPWIRRAAALGSGLLLALVACELAFRLSGLRPPAARQRIGPPLVWKQEKNALGYHDHEWSLAKPPGTVRVLALGDSFTMGRRVHREDLFVKRVERGLNRRAQGRRRYEVYNLSDAGWDTQDELDALRDVGLDYAPDAVLVVFFLNDATGLDSNPEIVRAMHDHVNVRDGWLNRVSRAWDYVDHWRRKRDVARRTFADYRASFRGSPEARAQWERSRAALAELAALADEHDFRLGLVVFPVLLRLSGGHGLEDLYAEVETACAELGIPTLNLLSTFEGLEPRSLWIGPMNAHPNARANELAAAPIEAFLVEAGLVPDPASE